MTPEEKAKRYDEALKMAKSIIKNDKDHVLYEEDIIEIFPELKENEDEKIRKELTEFLKSASGGFLDTAIQCKTYGKWVVWLEKQENFSKKEVDDAYLKGVADTKNEIEKQYEATYQIRKDIATFLFNYRGDIKDRTKWMDYLGIKVSFVESKFHVGDWVVDNYNCVWKIEGILNQFYILECPEGGESRPTTDWVDRTFHLWTIKDAKDGDVLFHSDSASNGIFIFKEISQWGTLQKVMCYCDYDSEDGFCLGENHTCCWADSKILHPATKEQRDLLFQKMKEAGYECAADNKELKITDWDKHIKYNPKTPSITKEKLTWSKEDDRIYYSLLADIRIRQDDRTSTLEAYYNEQIEWLKSLKERIGEIKL